MAAEIRARTGLPPDDEIVDLALAELVDVQPVVLNDPEPRSNITRRSLIRRLALSYRGAASMLPVVETIFGAARGRGDAAYPDITEFRDGAPDSGKRKGHATTHPRSEIRTERGRGDRRNVGVGASYFTRLTL